jgi:hypothetical protein
MKIYNKVMTVMMFVELGDGTRYKVGYETCKQPRRTLLYKAMENMANNTHCGLIKLYGWQCTSDRFGYSEYDRNLPITNIIELTKILDMLKLRQEVLGAWA